MSGKSQTSKNTAGEVTTHRFRAHIHTPLETSARGISLKWSWMNCIPGLRQKQTQISGRGFHLRMSASASTREMGLRFFFLFTAFPCLPAHAVPTSQSYQGPHQPFTLKAPTVCLLRYSEHAAVLPSAMPVKYFLPCGALACFCLPSGYSCPSFSDETSLPRRSLP